MGYYASALQLECGYKRCKMTLTIRQETPPLSFSMLLAKAAEAGWWTDPGSDRCMCPGCDKLSRLNYEKKLEKEKERVEL